MLTHPSNRWILSFTVPSRANNEGMTASQDSRPWADERLATKQNMPAKNILVLADIWDFLFS